MSGGKADTGGVEEGTPEAAGVLDVANNASYEILSAPDQVGLAPEAAQNIVGFRLGDDGQVGTADDRAFGSLAELDAVPFVGPIAFGELLQFAQAHGYVHPCGGSGGYGGYGGGSGAGGCGGYGGGGGRYGGDGGAGGGMTY